MLELNDNTLANDSIADIEAQPAQTQPIECPQPVIGNNGQTDSIPFVPKARDERQGSAHSDETTIGYDSDDSFDWSPVV
jgi:hypothetical protein